MFDTSKDLLYLAIALAVLMVAGGTTFVLIAAGKLIKKAQATVEDVNNKLAKFDAAVEEAAPAMAEVAQSVRQINANIVRPLSNIGEIFKKFSRIGNIFMSK